MDVFQYLHSWGRACLQCGSGAEVLDTLFCRECSGHLMKKMQARVELLEIENREVPLLSLFRWAPRADPDLSKLVHALKGGRLARSYAEFARWIPRFVANECTLVPAPSSSRTETMWHAKRWAEVLSEKWGWPLCSPLSLTLGLGRQKEKLRWQRLSSTRFLGEKVSSRVLFVDDVVTTGATVQAAFRALGKPKFFAVFCFARRVRGDVLNGRNDSAVFDSSARSIDLSGR